MTAGKGVGIDAKMNFRPEKTSAKLKLQKDA